MKLLNRRKILYIDPPFQNSFLKYTVGSAIGVSGFYFLAIRIFFWRFKAKGASIGLSPNHVFFRFLDDQRASLDLIFAVATLLMSACLVIYGLYLSNRIAGPIYHLKKYLKAFREGRSQGPLKFRTHDYFTAVADEVNATLGAPRKESDESR